MRVRSLKVTARHLNNAGCCYEYNIVSVPRIARRYIQCSGGRQAGREAEERGMMEDGREGTRGGRDGGWEQGKTREGRERGEGGRKR